MARQINLRDLGGQTAHRTPRSTDPDPAPTDETRAVFGLSPGDGLETPPERVYARQAQVLLARRAWLRAEQTRQRKLLAARRHVARVRAIVAAEGLPVPGQRRRDWSAGVPPLPEPASRQRPTGGPPGAGSRAGRAAYWSEIGPPPVCGPDDRVAAAAFARRVAGALERGGWNNADRAALYELYHRWARRARGEDVRFRLAGSARGRLPRDVERRIALMARDETP